MTTDDEKFLGRMTFVAEKVMNGQHQEEMKRLLSIIEKLQGEVKEQTKWAKRNSDVWKQQVEWLKLKQLERDKALEVAEKALSPFSHDDLSKILGGNCQGGDSPVFQGDKGILRIKDFTKAQEALAKIREIRGK